VSVLVLPADISCWFLDLGNMPKDEIYGVPVSIDEIIGEIAPIAA
jgi:hypothetical protein